VTVIVDVSPDLVNSISGSVPHRSTLALIDGESVVRVRTSSDLTSRSVQAKIANLHILRVFRNTSGTQASVSTHQTSTFTVIFGIFRENRRHDPVAHPHRPLAVT
jgi:hypothetical protein